MATVGHNNLALQEVLQWGHARPTLDKHRLGEMIDLISNIQVGNEDARSRDVLGRVSTESQKPEERICQCPLDR